MKNTIYSNNIDEIHRKRKNRKTFTFFWHTPTLFQDNIFLVLHLTMNQIGVGRKLRFDYLFDFYLISLNVSTFFLHQIQIIFVNRILRMLDHN